MNSVLVPISIGELFDKISILQLKEEKIIDKEKLSNIKKELNLLNEISKKIDTTDFCDLIHELKNTNNELWIIEERKRKKEKLKQFDDEFIDLARNVFLKNDKRAEIKKKINICSNSLIVEEKSYEKLSSNS